MTNPPVGPAYIEPTPTYAEPAPVYTESTYVDPSPVYSDPAPVYTDPAPLYTEPTDDGSSKVDTAKDAAKETAATAKDEALAVKDTAVDVGKNVAATAKDEATNVVAETKEQAKSLLGSVTSQVKDQAGTQQSKLAETAHGWAKELGGMASASEESGPITDLAHQASAKVGEVAHFLETKEPTDVLAAVSSFARRRPALFLVICGAAGVLAGRATRGAVAANTSVDSPAPASFEAPAPRRELGATTDAYPPAAAPEFVAPASLVDETPAYDDSYAADYAAAGATGYAGDANGARTDYNR